MPLLSVSACTRRRSHHFTVERRRQTETEVLGPQSQQCRQLTRLSRTTSRGAAWRPRVVSYDPVCRVVPLDVGPNTIALQINVYKQRKTLRNSVK